MELVSLSLLLLAFTPSLSGMTISLPDHPLIFKEGSSNTYVPSNVLEEESRTTAVNGEDDGDSFTEQCYEDQLKYDLIYQMDWNTLQAKDAISIIRPADFIVVLDGGDSCYSKADCMFTVQQQAIPNLGDACKLRENFYIGGDGNVYEGRGWSIAPYWYLYGIRNQSLTVKFMGSFDSQLPSHNAMRAFKSLLVAGVWLGTLSPRYQIVSIRELTNSGAYLGESLHQDVQEWVGWVDNTVPMSRWEYQQPGFLNFVFRREWKATDPLMTPQKTDQPVSYVLLNNVDQRCHSRKACISRMQSLQQSTISHYGDLLDNFYIGEDGNVYEGRGWDFLPQWHVEGMQSSYVSVSFLGTFDSEVPLYRAISSFKELIHSGIRLRKLSTNYQVTSLRVIYGDQVFLGDALQSYVQKWTPWVKSYDSLTPKERMEANLVPFITRSGRGFDVKENTKAVRSKPNLPVKFIILKDGGECCFHANICTNNMISERNKYLSTYGDLLDSFYVGSDGIVYEGRGWDNSPPLYLKHLRQSFITVKFLGAFEDSMPNNITLRAFHSFIKLGIDLGKISPSYQIYSLRHIYNDSSFLGDALSQYAEGLPQWSSEMVVDDDQERESRGLLPLVSRDDWNATSLGENFVAINSSVLHVFIGGTGDRCFSLSECTLQIQEQQIRGRELCGSLTDHFYIGDDGNVYEGLGWVEYASGNKSQERAISVRFFGYFHNDTPSRLAMSGFRRLLGYGLNAHKLSEGYKVVSYRQLCNCTDDLGEEFQREMENLDRYSNETISSNALDSLPYDPFRIVPNATKNSYSSISYRGVRVFHPAEYVVISDGGNRCVDREQCLSQVKSLPSGGDNYENFFVGEDGRSYEVSGWRTNIYGEYFCKDCNMIFIGFLGKFNYDLPSSDAISVFNYLMKSGIRWGKIHPDYKLVSIRQICSNCSLVGDSLNIAVRSWRHWNEQINITADCKPFHNEIVPAHSWRIRSQYYSSSNEYSRKSFFPTIEIQNSGTHCSTKEECITWLQNQEDDYEKMNFYVGDDGNVYEGLGWEWSRVDNYYNRNYYYNHHINEDNDVLRVLFIGDFNRDVSSSAAILAFKNLIVKQGIKKGRLGSSYTLRGSISGLYGDKVSDMLRKI